MTNSCINDTHLPSTKSQRRAILMNLLKQFDDTSRNSLPMMLYLADNLAYIPYTVIDEPLFLIHHIDIMVSVIGCNILQVIIHKIKNVTVSYVLNLFRASKKNCNGLQSTRSR